ncbi:Flp family type IVb pilin [Azohydromonas caseinilytica]|uniref:Flp family type IVb pilin n=1 Tax=Azohydromonas caseinilytica TaxID=2728836 RepID=A0A848F6T7_9BURK|nr:Flp family type IVb pilin [Azohydromonas caseinilytica]NML15294.1 Flp family type IVb pilin [Azohydromonas caseinilytica]
MNLIQHLKNFVREEDGVTAIEYALVASLIALAAATAMSGLGTKLGQMFTAIGNKLVTT